MKGPLQHTGSGPWPGASGQDSLQGNGAAGGLMKHFEVYVLILTFILLEIFQPVQDTR